MKYALHRAGDGRWVHTWVRQSAIKTADMCMERFRNDIFGLTEEPTKDASSLGTVCHAVAEDALSAVMDGYGPMEESDLHAAFDYYWGEMGPTIERWESYTPSLATTVGKNKLSSWYAEVYPTVTPVAVEHYFEVPLIEDDERVVNLTGTVDLVESNRLWDWKFPKRDYSRTAWEYERWDVQSIAYCYALGIPNFSYAIMHPDGVGRMDLVRDQTHFDWLRTKVLALCRYVEAMPTAPWVLGDNGWWCSEKWCANWAHCKGSNQGES